MIIKKLPSFKRPFFLLNKRQTIKSITNPLPGLDIGIPLTIFQNTFTSLHYGESIVTTRDVLLQFLIGYYVYGSDRYSDALEYCENPYSTPKKDLYEYIYMYKIWNNDSIKTKARDLKLKEINWQFSDSLDVFLKRYLKKTKLNDNN